MELSYPSYSRLPERGLFTSPRDWRLGKELATTASLLFEQQMWCLGQDIKHEPNLLISYGFTRERPPEGIRGSTMYRSDGFLLWGFGVIAIGRGLGSIGIRRGSFSPTWTHQEVELQELWQVEEFPSFTLPTSHRDNWRAALLLERTFNRLADYEGWVTKVCGADYRRSLLRSAPAKKTLSARSLESAWREILKKYSSCTG